ncbi:MAG: FHA domain-containing protein [Methylacidiphilales bacterium]|nr:FHA domain-containing protein [Candidatus Methylacidiphilales bacterium]
MSFYQLLPSFQEAFSRLAQTREKGCLLVFNAQEAIHLFVLDGVVVAAHGGKLDGDVALDQAFKLQGASYGWIPGAEPSRKTLEVDMQEYVHRSGIVTDSRFGKTIRMPSYQERQEKKVDRNFFLIPEDAPTVKLRIKKSTNVMGREATCDIYIDSNQVSRRHCLLQVTDRGILVKDLDSTNGTFVNGIPMTDGYINSGDRLSLGTYSLMLHRDKA